MEKFLFWHMGIYCEHKAFGIEFWKEFWECTCEYKQQSTNEKALLHEMFIPLKWCLKRTGSKWTGKGGMLVAVLLILSVLNFILGFT